MGRDNWRTMLANDVESAFKSTVDACLSQAETTPSRRHSRANRPNSRTPNPKTRKGGKPVHPGHGKRA